MDKQQAQTIIKETCEKPFNKDRFNGFIKNFLNQIEDTSFKYQGNYIPDDYKPFISKYERIGKYNDGEKRIDILIVYLNKETSIERARTRQRNFIAGYLDGKYGSDVSKDAALVAFVAPNEEDWRFSLVKMDYRFKQAEDGKVKVKEEFTPARRWSFLVGKNESSHTAQSRLVPILADDEHNPTLAQMEEAFNIEKVTREFFEKYRELFLWVKETLDKIIKQDAKIKADFEAKSVNTVDFAKKLLGQIVFLYFLQKKGWFGVERDAQWGTGSKQFLRELFKGKHGNYTNFFNDILEPLFYEALRINRRHDDDYYKYFNCKIPFLNGGLFDPIGGYDWVHTDILLPNELFSNQNRTKEGDTGNGILDIFDRYNFTVKEDEPLEKEVAIDPEMLGKVFENLLEVKDRKSKGTYYTPREIVHYMCQQSLINYLYTELNKGTTAYQEIGDIQTDAFGNKAKVGQLDLTVKYKSGPQIAKEDIETLIEYGEQVGENEATVVSKGRETDTYSYKLPESIRKNARLIDGKLANIKVCDPAIGSGAFPVGMMHEIVKTRNVLSVYINDPDRTIYHFKRECIEKSLYGVDIDPGAVEIAKLRLWLSLVVDEEDIKQIKPLPNLDYKIVCGNSLLGYPYTPTGLEKIERLKELFFNETRPKEKNELREQIDHSIYDLFKNTENSLGYRVTVDFKINFSEVFHDNKGFDVVIANPPYVGEKGHKEMFREIKKGNLGRFYQGKMDLFYFFYHISLDIGKQHSNIAFITTNYYPTATGAKKLRQDFKERAIIKNLVNFNELRIFESALGQHNMITILEKSHNERAIAQTCISQRQGVATPEILQQIQNRIDTETQYYKVAQKDLYDGDENYIRLIGSSEISNSPIQTILERVRKQGESLGIICNVNQGIVTGADKVSKKHIKKYRINAKVGDGIFVISDKEVRALNLTKAETEVLKPWFKNSDINRWKTLLHGPEQIIYSNYNTIDNIGKFPDIEKHLKKYRKIIAQYAYRWHDLHRSREKEIFESPKIVVPQRSPRNTFGYNEIPWYAASDVFFITKKNEHKDISLKYILALLNSKLYYVWLYFRGKRKGETLELIAKPLSEIPIKKIHESEQKPFIELVDRILAITEDEDYLQNHQKQAQVNALEQEIDQMVYQLYGLNEEEIRIVEGDK